MKRSFTILAFICVVILFGCSSGPSEEDLAASVEAQLAAAIAETGEAATLAAAGPTLTPTPAPTDTPAPTNTAVPTDTAPPTITPTPRPTDTPKPTRTPIPTDTPTPVPSPVVLTGSGDNVIDLEGWPSGDPAILHITYSGPRSNFSVWNYDARGERINLLVNTIGTYDGFLPMDFFEGEKTSRFEVTAAGAWTIEVLPVTLEYLHAQEVPGTYEGTGDDIVFLTGADPDVGDFNASFDGNFAVWGLMSGGNRDLLINQIAPYEGRIIIPRGTFLLIVTAAGPWLVKITGR